jgi:hypothetical protein
MTTPRNVPVWLFAVGLSIPAVASAQEPQPLTTPPPASSITIERVEHDVVFVPDTRITDVNGHTSTLVGGYVGLMTDRTWVVGGGGYWLANQDDDLEMWYGGLVVNYLLRQDERIGFGLRGLVGGGYATVGTTAGEYFGVKEPVWPTEPGPFRNGRIRERRHGGPFVPIGPDTPVLASEYFFVFEPTLSVIWHLTDWARLDLGAGYRLAAGAGPLDDDLRGPAASIAIQFGGTRRAKP